MWVRRQPIGLGRRPLRPNDRLPYRVPNFLRRPAGTFHGVGARLLREYAESIGLSPMFTINDREDCADLMNVVRHERGLSAKERRFPVKATCLAISSRVVNTGATLAHVLEHAFPWCFIPEPLLPLFDVHA